MTDNKTREYNTEVIVRALGRADVAAVATHEGAYIRQRQMHFAYNDDLSVYFATMKGDPKTLQITNEPNVSVLILDRSGEMETWSETEITGKMEIISGDSEKKRASALLYNRSPIVKNLIDSKADQILEWIILKPAVVKYRVFGEIVQGFPPTVKYISTQNTNSIQGDLKKIVERLKIWYEASRALFLVASALPVLLGTIVAYYVTENFSVLLFLLTLLAVSLFHLGANLLNDYLDHIGGSDQANKDFIRPFTGGSRIIQLGILSPVSILFSSVMITVLGIIIGLYLMFTVGPNLLYFGAIGLFVLSAYSLPKIGLASIGLGEISIGLVLGPLITLGAFYVQTGTLTMLPVVASIPLAGLIALTLFINEFPDALADKSVGKNTLVVKFGLKNASTAYLIFGIITYLATAYFIYTGMLPAVVSLVFVSIPFVLWGWHIARKNITKPKSIAPACGATASAHLIAGLAVIISFASAYTGYYDFNTLGPSLVIVLAILFAIYIYKNKKSFESAEKTFT